MTALELIDEAKRARAREIKACQELGLSQRTVQRWRSENSPNEDQRPHAKRPAPSNKLSNDEVQKVIEVVNQPKYKSLPPSQIVPILADEGTYIASESTIYRIMRRHDMQHFRGRSKKPNTKPISTHKATGPNQVWMWDITWLPGPARGIYFYLYMIIDLYSRKVVAWDVWLEESSENASSLVRRAVMLEQCSNKQKPLVLHSDNGSPMKGAALLETMYHLGITPSRSRPRVSNDNPFAESLFRTCKYRPEYPYKGFIDITHARTWVLSFVRWYNNEHRHSGLKFLTPQQRHNGTCSLVLRRRLQVYECARKRTPQRWTRNVRNWTLEDEVWLNPDKQKHDGPAESVTACS
jgi:putative transposase